MTRQIKTIKIGDVTRYRTLITDVESSGLDKARRQIEFLQDIAGNGFFTGMLSCGPLPFETFNMFHDGSAWIVELEAQEKKDG
jgi:hypothetical protein